MINAKLLQLVIEASNDGIVVAEQEGDDNILIYANPAFERLTGYAVDDILYQDCRFLQSGDRDQPGLQAIREAIRANQPCRQIIRNYRKDGTPFWNELSITRCSTRPTSSPTSSASRRTSASRSRLPSGSASWKPKSPS